jgi:hypothetical protein
MTVLLVSTVRRRTPPNEPSGYLYAVELESRRILRKCNIVEPAYRGLDSNPRGGMRGSKGISIGPDQIAVANSVIVFRYDSQWNLLGFITHPSCAGIHDILLQGSTIWVASSRTDLLFKFDLLGDLLQHYYLRKLSPATNTLNWHPPILLTPKQIEEGSIDFRDPRTHKEEEADNAHVNSMAFLPNGSLLVSLGFVVGLDYAKFIRVKKYLIRLGLWPVLLKVDRRMRVWLGFEGKRLDEAILIRPAKAQSAILRVSPAGDLSLCLTIPNTTSPAHSLCVLPDGTAIFLDTTHGSVVHFDPDNGKILSNTKVTNGFLRGITMVSERSLILGSNTDLINFNMATRNSMDRFRITDDPHESVYDIKILPSHFVLPPVSLAENFSKVTGYQDATMLIESLRKP